ncbi:uncharacterized protein L203_105488 [Cryptococcus depauperatus CBS 7841]|uniref:Large ribosomal subunit protein uL30m n=1 Tax=Cryptococcus depauperatus CBS 7841 TaxID=1295531 RepID=A0A1E3ICY9_9TREE|nr:hypothetical protein L203_04166 [Cryptococcus depauperatus CBS 7841]
MLPKVTLSSARFYATQSSQPTHHLVTLTRSTIGLPSSVRDAARTLGLRKRYKPVLRPFGEVTAGRILKIKELVRVTNVTKEEGKLLCKRRKQGSGVEVAGRQWGGGKGL